MLPIGFFCEKRIPLILCLHLGESSPGLAARLGMGLGISFLAVLLIGEIVFLYWKFKSQVTRVATTRLTLN